MIKTDIKEKQLYITEIINVINAKIENKGKCMSVKSRHSDAFVYVIEGGCSYTFNGGEYSISVNEGDMLYLSENAVYTMDIHSDVYCALYCDFKFGCEDERRSSAVTAENAEALFRRLYKSFTKSGVSCFCDSMSLLYEIYAMFVRALNRDYIDNSVKKRIKDAKEFVDANLKNSSLSVGMLSEKAGMSEVYFRKLFKSQYRISPSRYIIEKRIEKAKQLMNYSFLPLSKCAEEAGFSSLQYFCRVFKNETGTTPDTYRKWV